MEEVKERLCEAFCGMLSVHQVPAGFAVGTGHDGLDGDRIGFYIVGPDALGQYVVQDDGMTISMLEGMGVDLSNKVRKGMLAELREQYAVRLDDGELKTTSVKAEDVGPTAIRFMAFMLRVQDLLLTTTERAASTFKEDATKLLKEMVAPGVMIQSNFVVHEAAAEYPADIGILTPNGRPIALFFAMTETRVLEALLLQSIAEKNHIPCSIIALLETEDALSKKARARANNHLDAVPYFREDPRAACERILREARV